MRGLVTRGLGGPIKMGEEVGGLVGRGCFRCMGRISQEWACEEGWNGVLGRGGVSKGGLVKEG